MDTENILDRLKCGEIFISDGAFGTLLIQKGLEPGSCPDEVNLKNPEIIEYISRQYLDAGAQIIHTNTFGASPMKLADFGLDNKTEEINKNAVIILRKAIGDSAIISASIGPSGKILKPYGDMDTDELYRGYKRQLTAVFEAGVDMVTVETMTDLQEAVIAVKCAKEISPRTPVCATMTFDKTPRGFFTIMGVNIKESAAGLEEVGADVIGSNCGNGIDIMIEIAREFKHVSSLPIIIQSNAGKPELKNGSVFYPETPEYFAEKTEALIDAGTAIIGGCCGTTPEYIRAIRKIVDKKTAGR